MKLSDPAYDFFREDARAQGFETLADYFRHYGIVPPANYGKPKFKEKEISGGMDTHALEWIAHYGSLSKDKIDKSWGEPGPTIVRINRRWDETRSPEDRFDD